MLTPTHALTASTLYLALGGQSIAGAALSIGAALIPDLDSRQSLVGRALPFIAGPIEYQFGHRTITHSLLFQLAICGLAWALLPSDFALAITCGLVSHAFADMLTKSGVCWFWPSRVRCVLPGSPRFRFEVGGWGELAFAAAMAATAFGAVWLHQTTAGTGGVIRAAIGDIAAAREQYDEQKGSQAFELRLRGRDNTSFAVVEGVYPVVAAWSSSGLLIRVGDTVSHVCKSESCAIYPEHAVLVATGARQTSVRTVELASTSGMALRALLAPLEAVGEVFLSGSVRAKLEEDGATVQRHGHESKLYYARPAQIPPGHHLRDVRLTVQVRHKPGVTPPEIEPVPIAQTDQLDPLLRKWTR